MQQLQKDAVSVLHLPQDFPGYTAKCFLQVQKTHSDSSDKLHDKGKLCIVPPRSEVQLLDNVLCHSFPQGS